MSFCVSICIYLTNCACLNQDTVGWSNLFLFQWNINFVFYQFDLISFHNRYHLLIYHVVWLCSNLTKGIKKSLKRYEHESTLWIVIPATILWSVSHRCKLFGFMHYTFYSLKFPQCFQILTALLAKFLTPKLSASSAPIALMIYPNVM